MANMRFVFSLAAASIVAACGGSSGTDVVQNPNLTDMTPTPMAPVIPSTPITLTQINANAAGFASLLTDVGAREDLTELAPLDTVATLQASGNATFEGAFYVFSNAARVDGFVGNGVVSIGFDDPTSPTVLGGADGFIYVDGPELAAVIETEDFVALPGDTPVYEATGNITFANGELANTAGVAAAGFEIAGSLRADTGAGIEEIDVVGAMAVLFDGDQAFGIGGDTSDPAFDLSMPDAFFFGTSDD
jgi:hypothetical protein